MSRHLLELPEPELKRRLAAPSAPGGIAAPRLNALLPELDVGDTVIFLGSDQRGTRAPEIHVLGDSEELALLLKRVCELTEHPAAAVAAKVTGVANHPIEQLTGVHAAVGDRVASHPGPVVAVGTGGTPALRAALGAVVAMLADDPCYWAVVDRHAAGSAVVKLGAAAGARLANVAGSQAVAQAAEALVRRRAFHDLHSVLVSAGLRGAATHAAAAAALEDATLPPDWTERVVIDVGTPKVRQIARLKLLALRAVTARARSEMGEATIRLRQVYEHVHGTAGVTRVAEVSGTLLPPSSPLKDALQDYAHGDGDDERLRTQSASSRRTSG